MARSSGSGSKTPKPTRDAAAEAQRYAPECYACPIGTASMALQRLRPEATEHFLRAGRELVLGMRSFVDVLAELLRTMEERSQSARSLERIEIRRS